MIDVSWLSASLPGNLPQGIAPKYQPAYSRMQNELKQLAAVSVAPVNSLLKKSEAAFFKEVWRKRGFTKPAEILLSLFAKFPVADSRRLHSPFFNGLLTGTLCFLPRQKC